LKKIPYAGKKNARQNKIVARQSGLRKECVSQQARSARNASIAEHAVESVLRTLFVMTPL
jgi:hypothetical protein